MQIFAKIFKWLIDVLDWATQKILAIFGLKMVGEHFMFYSIDELRKILSDSEEFGVIQPPELKMLESKFDLGELLVRQVMIPRTEIVAVEADTPLEEIITLISKSTYTKIPVYEDNLDQILGIVHVKDMLQIMQSPDYKSFTARDLLREALYVPETTSVNALLQHFRDKRQHIAIVLDEYGGTAGLVTLEDLLEEIVGEVSDQFDLISPEIQKMPDGSVLIDGLTLIEEVNEQLGLKLEDPNYDTIAGYVLGKLGRLPQENETINLEGMRIRIEAMDGLRISRLSLKKLGETHPEQGQSSQP